LLIVPAGRDESYLITEQRAGVRVVFIDRAPTLIAADAVVSDNERGAITAVEHLLRVGHRRIGYLGDSQAILTAQARFDGYRRALSDAGVPLDETIVRHELRTIEAAQEAARAMLDAVNAPTAIFASQNLVTIGAIRAMAALAQQDSVALVGFDDFVLADTLRPGITTIAQDPTEMGRLAAKLLFGRLDGDRSDPKIHVVPTRLIARGSGEIRPP
jgi:LacI family transcriptional regulator